MRIKSAAVAASLRHAPQATARVSKHRVIAFKVERASVSLAPSAEWDSPDTQVWRDDAGAQCGYSYRQGKYAWLDLPSVARFRLDRSARAITAFATVDTDPDLIREWYLHSVLPLAAHYFGYEALHASAVGTPRGVVAFCAAGEIGKSTFAAALSARGYRLWADDALVLAVRRSSSRALLFPFQSRLRPPSAKLLKLESRRGEVLGGARGSTYASSPLAALCVLERVADRHAAGIERLMPSHAFAAMLPHACYFTFKDEIRNGVMFARYLDLCAKTPVFRIRFIPTLRELPRLLDTIERAIPAFGSESPVLDVEG